MQRRLLNSSIKARIRRFAISFVVLGPLLFFTGNHLDRHSKFQVVFSHHTYTKALLAGLITSGLVHEGYIKLHQPGWDDHLVHLFREPLSPPYNLEIKLLASPLEPDAIRLSIGESPAGKYILSLSDTSPQQSGVYIENSGGVRKVLDLSGAARPLAKERSIALSVRCEPSLIHLNLAGKRAQFKPAEGYDLRSMEIRTASPARRTFVDLFRITRPAPGGGEDVLLGGNFQPAPLFLNTHRLLGIPASSLSFKALSFILLSLVALLLDLALLSLIPGRRFFHLTDRGALLLLFPLQVVVVLSVRSALALHFIPAATCLLMLAIEKTFAVMRSGFGFQQPPFQIRRRLLTVVLVGAAVASYLAIIALALPAPSKEKVDMSGLMPVICSTPLVLFAAGALLKSQNVLVIFLALVLQLLGYVILAMFSPLDLRVAYFTITVAPWLVGTMIDLIKRASLARLLRLPAALLLFTILLLNTEACTRGLVDTNWIKDIWTTNEWNIEELTDLLGNQQQRNEINLSHRAHQVSKPNNVFRILCLGSSSTEGHGSTSPGVDSYPVQLEAFLNRQHQGRLEKKIEVINAGKVAMSFFGIKVFYEEVLARLRPDLIIVYFGANGENADTILYYLKMKEKVRRAPHIKTKEEAMAAMRLRWTPRWLLRSYLTLTRSHLLMFIIYVAQRFKAALPGKVDPAEHTVEFPKAYRDNSRAPEALLRQAIKRGAKVLLIPEMCQSMFEPQAKHKPGFQKTFAKNCVRYESIFDRLARKYAQQGVHYFNMREIFSRGNNISYLYDEMHMRNPGYKFLAEEIGKFLRNKSLLPLSPEP